MISGTDRRERPGGSLPKPARGSRNIWSVTHSFGPIMFVVFGTDLPGFADEVHIALPEVQLIWPHDHPVTWTPSPCCNTEQLLAFGKGFADLIEQLGSTF